MWDRLVEELMSIWAYLSLNEEERKRLLEDKEENSSESDDSDSQ